MKNNNPVLVTHPFEPVFDENSKVLLLGSFPSPASREVGFYYGHPKNRFWSVLSEVLGEPLPNTIEDKKHMLLSHNIAIWDTLASCEIVGASDNSIKNAMANDIAGLKAKSKIKAVFTLGKTSTNLYKKYVGNDCIYLPSTSPANCAVKTETLVKEFRQILKYLN